MNPAQRWNRDDEKISDRMNLARDAVVRMRFSKEHAAYDQVTQGSGYSGYYNYAPGALANQESRPATRRARAAQ